MSVDVAVGTGKIDSGSGYAYNVWSDAINNVAITTADATNPRRDIIVAYVDKSVVSSASNDNPGALKFIAVAGTPAGSPTDPSGATIQSAVGASNPYIQLARVAVAAGATSITNANITDLRTTVTVNANIGGSDGWSSLGYTPATITANGNRSYSLAFTGGIDLTSQLSAGMRLRTTRTTAAPTQSTSLNGTTQYYSKSSPSGMTFTDDFVVSAWVKASSYAASSIVGRYNGTSGWRLVMEADGRISLSAFNAGAGNFSQVISYQSIPLNKWVHVAAQLDMSTFTATTTTSYVMIDGVDVPATVARSGTNPTTLVQAGDLNIGAANGAIFFPGKIAQAAIYSAKVTQATVKASMNQTLTGSETSLISAYSFNNTINDLSANANNLTANGSAVATNADSPFAQAATAGSLEYGIITGISFSTNSTITIQVPEGSAIPTSGGVSAVSYSTQKVPYGFPADNKFRINAWDNSGTLTNPQSALMVQFVVNRPFDSIAYTNPGAAGGIYYLNQEGETRIVNGKTNAVSTGAAPSIFSITLPTGFLGTYRSSVASPTSMTALANQFASIASPNTANVDTYVTSPSGAASSKVEFTVIGSP